MAMSKSHIGVAAALLAAVVAGAVGLAGVADRQTHERIAANERDYLRRAVAAVIADEDYDNDLLQDAFEISDPELLGSTEPVVAYRATRAGIPVALVLEPLARGGYGGPIHLRVGIRRDGTVTGVRVRQHRETPGLGDAIEIERSDWIEQFTGRSLDNPQAAGWAVRKQGGEFDQFTGATVTPRAVVKGVRNALLYFAANRPALVQDRAAPDEPDNGPRPPTVP